MSKINATYSSGYYIAPDVDFRKLEDQQRLEQRGKRRKPGTDSADAGDDNVKRQTFAIPFDLFCLHCNHRIVRGSHVYTNRRATDQRYLDTIRVWELEIMCRFCKGRYYLRTDPETPKETGGYICVKGCKRVEGDFYALNQENKAAREEWEKAKADAELDPLAALEKENEAARQLEERNRRIEEEVEQQAEHNDSDLLAMLRNRPRRQEGLAGALSASGSDDDDEDGRSGAVDHTSLQLFEKAKDTASASSGLPPPPSASAMKVDREGSGDSGGEVDDVDEDAEDADERSYREFEADMARRWRALEREQRAQRRRELESTTAKPTVDEDEVSRVLARYGGARRAVPSTADGAHAVPGTSAPSASTHTLPGVSGDATPRDAPAMPSAPSQHRNKFLVEEEDDDVGTDGLWKAQGAGGSASTPVRPVASFVKSAPALSSVTSRPAGNALLRNLVDSDSDDDAP